MNLSEFAAKGLPLDLADYALVYDQKIYDAVIAAQDPAAQFRVQPFPLPNGSWFSCANLLSEVDGIFAPMFNALPDELAVAVDVLPMVEITAMLGRDD